MHRTTVAGAVAAAVLLAPGAAAGTVAPATQLVLPPAPLAPGAPIDVSGSGFVLPEPEGCQVTWDGPAPAATTCGIDGIVYATLTIGSLVEVPRTYTVTVCVPSCEHPWAGSLSAPLAVEATPEPTPSPTPTKTTDVGAPTLGENPPVIRLAALQTQRTRVDPNPAHEGDDVVVVAPSLPVDPTGLTDCQLAWDGVPAGRCSAGAEGSLTGDLVVPEGAAAGAHEVTACRPTCSDAVGGRKSGSVVVAAVSSPAGSTATATVPQVQLVPVPRLRGMTLEDARRVLPESGLRLGSTTGRGRVAGQGPRPRELVREGTAVDVRLRPAPPPGPVEVPLVVGSTVPEARAALAPLGLALAGLPEDLEPGGSATIDGQEPAAGTGVLPGSLVRVSFAPSPPDWGGWLLALALGAGALLLGGGASVAVSRRPGSLGTATPGLRPQPDPSPDVRTEVSVPTQRSLPLRLRSRPDPDPRVLTEVHDDHAR